MATLGLCGDVATGTVSNRQEAAMKVDNQEERLIAALQLVLELSLIHI